MKGASTSCIGGKDPHCNQKRLDQAGSSPGHDLSIVLYLEAARRA